MAEEGKEKGGNLMHLIISDREERAHSRHTQIHGLEGKRGLAVCFIEDENLRGVESEKEGEEGATVKGEQPNLILYIMRV